MAGLFGDKDRTAGLAGGEANRTAFIISEGVSKTYGPNSLKISQAYPYYNT